MTDPQLEAKVRAVVSEIRDPRVHFAENFSDRVIARLKVERSNTSADVFQAAVNRQAKRLIPALLAASFALIAWNWQASHASADSALAAALGLEPVAVVSSTSPVALDNTEMFQ